MDKKLSKTLSAGTHKVLQNALDLYNEALLLTKAGALSRALFLHQISMEECAKVEILGANAVALLMGESVNFKKVAEGFRSHERKNKVNAYFLNPLPREQSAGKAGRIAESSAAFEIAQRHFHNRSNLEKNSALYVDFDDGHFKAPAERITAKMVARIGTLSGRFLNMSAHKTELLDRFADDSEKYRRQTADFKNLLDKLKAENPKDPAKAFDTFVDEVLAMAGK